MIVGGGLKTVNLNMDVWKRFMPCQIQLVFDGVDKKGGVGNLLQCFMTRIEEVKCLQRCRHGR